MKKKQKKIHEHINPLIKGSLFKIKPGKKFLIFLSLAAGTQQAFAEDIKWISGFYAATPRTITSGANQLTFIYRVLGAAELTYLQSNKQHQLSVECLGFDDMTTGKITGNGRCIFRDRNDDHIYTTVTTKGNKNHYKITGGTGHWKNISGYLDTQYINVPPPSDGEFVGIDKGFGKLEK